jgi:hypothetical protein
VERGRAGLPIYDGIALLKVVSRVSREHCHPARDGNDDEQKAAKEAWGNHFPPELHASNVTLSAR